MGFWEVLSIAGSAIFVLFFIGMCIFVHELGHFLAAKWRGLHIDAFSLGFRKIWSKKVNGIEYRLGWLPFGGYVELPQVDTTEAVPHAADGSELPHAKPLDRIITAVAGPAFNIVFGLLLGCVIWVFGMSMPPDSTKLRSMEVVTVNPEGPEYAAGLREGDRIVKLNGRTFNVTWLELARNIMLTTGEVELGVVRDGKDLTIRYVPSLEPNPEAPENLKFEGMPWPFFAVRIPVEIHPDAGSPLAKAGVKSGDLILAINGTPIKDTLDLQMFFDDHAAEPMTFRIRRSGQEMEIGPVQFPLEKPVYRLGIAFDESGKVLYIGPGSPAEKQGLKIDDVVLAFNGVPYSDLAGFQQQLAANEDREASLRIRRGAEEMTLAVQPRRIDIAIVDASVGTIAYPTPWQQFMDTCDLSYRSLTGMLTYLGNKLYLTDTQSAVKPRNMSGPVGMATILFGAVNHSFTMGIYFVVVVCFALAIFNLLPLPVLDGGHTFIGILEIIFRRPMPRAVIRALSYMFVGLLVFFMLYVTFYDVWRLVNIFTPADRAAMVQQTQPEPEVPAEPAGETAK